jgi:hypothetical protein
VITTQPHGTTIERRADGWVRRDRDGGVQAELRWAGDRLAALTVTGYDPRALRVDGAVAAHPVLGATHALTVDGVEVARMSAIDWRRPAAIPAIDRPGALPPGTGTMLLDTIARLARDAGVPALRYAGPYPTAALWAALAASFRAGRRSHVSPTRRPATRRRALGVAIDWRRRHGRRGSPRHLRRAARSDGSCSAAPASSAAAACAGWSRRQRRRQLVFGDRAWARLTRAAAPHFSASARRPASAAAGAGRGADQVIADAPLTAAALADVPIVWGDAGLAAARDVGACVIVHVGLWHHLAPHGLARVALALGEALTPIAIARAVAALPR